MLLSFAALLSCGAGRATAATYFVDRDSRGGPCSDLYDPSTAQDDPHKPYCSLDALAPRVPAGSRILVRGGRYPDWNIAGADESSYVHVEPYPGEIVQTTGVLLHSSSHWWITGMDLVGSDPALGSQYATGRFAVNDSSHVRLEDNYIHDALGGLYTKNAVDDVTFAHNVVSAVRCVGVASSCPDPYKSGYGVATASGPVTDLNIDGNSFSDLDGDGVQLGCTDECSVTYNSFTDLHAQPGNPDHVDALQLSGGADGLYYAGNVVADASTAVCYCSDHVTPRIWKDIVFADNVFWNTGNYCLSLSPTSDLVIRNNLCWDNRYSGLRVSADPAAQPFEGLRVFNNIFGPCYDCHGDSSAMTPAAAGVTWWRNNLIVQNGQGRSYDPSDMVDPGDAELAGLFVDPESGDFRLRPGSIAIDAGVTDREAPVSLLDAAGQPRQVGTVDIGPYEYQGESPGPPEGTVPGPPDPGGPAGAEPPPSPAEGQPASAPAGAKADPSERAGPGAARPNFTVRHVVRRCGSTILRIQVPQRGHLILRGGQVHRWSARLGRASLISAPVKPARPAKRRLRRRGTVRIGVLIEYLSPGHGRESMRKTVRLTRACDPVRRSSLHRRHQRSK